MLSGGCVRARPAAAAEHFTTCQKYIGEQTIHQSNLSNLRYLTTAYLPTYRLSLIKVPHTFTPTDQPQKIESLALILADCVGFRTACCPASFTCNFPKQDVPSYSIPPHAPCSRVRAEKLSLAGVQIPQNICIFLENLAQIYQTLQVLLPTLAKWRISRRKQ